MYSRPQNRDIRIPINYGGSIFGGERAQGSTPVKDYTRKRYTPPHVVKYVEETPQQEPPEQEMRNDVEIKNVVEESIEHQEQEQKESIAEASEQKSEPHKSIFSPLGALGTEEILLIALALIIFQSENDPEISLILLALLFIN